MRFSLVVHVIGLIVRPFGAMFLAPLAVAVLYGEYLDAIGFAIVTVFTCSVGHLMRRAGGRDAEDAVEGMRRAEGLAVASLSWLVIAWFAGIPYMWNGLGQVDALFESMSGLTTTGATVFRDFSVYGKGIFFWRALTTWLGGMGVIALFIAILPRLKIGGREMFFAEASGPDEDKVAPQIRKTAAILWQLYSVLTLLMIIALLFTGLPLFDAVCNTFATISAAGFSPNPLSIAGYQNPAAEWVMIFFMFLAGANFALQYRALAMRSFRVAIDDEELRAYAGVVAMATVLVALAIRGADDAGAPLRTALFQVVSIITTSGFASVDFQLWNDQAKMVLLGLMFIGGCAGSAGGGPKVVRHVILAKYTLQELRRNLHPRAVLPVKLGGRVVPPAVIHTVIVFFLFYMLTFAICSAIVILLGADMITGISATAASIGNVGPGFNAVGPMANYADLHPLSRFILTLAMWIGRLEVITVLAILRLEAWRSGHWSSAPAAARAGIGDQGSGIRKQGSGIRDQGSGIRGSGIGGSGIGGSQF
jgi:trk system potassium uptake protein